MLNPPCCPAQSCNRGLCAAVPGRRGGVRGLYCHLSVPRWHVRDVQAVAIAVPVHQDLRQTPMWRCRTDILWGVIVVAGVVKLCHLHRYDLRAVSACVRRSRDASVAWPVYLPETRPYSSLFSRNRGIRWERNQPFDVGLRFETADALGPFRGFLLL